MAWEELLAGGAMGFFGSVPVAGPVALVVVTRGLNSDFKSGLAISAGAGVAEGFIAGLVFAGLGFASSKLEWLEPCLDFAGVAVLILIGFWFALKGVGGGAAKVTSNADDEGSPLRSYAIGAGMVLGNPGMLGTWGGAVAALEGAGVASASVAGAPFFGVGVSLGVVGWFWLVLLAIRRWRASLDGRWVDQSVRAIGVALIALGVAAGFSIYGGAHG